MGKNKNFAFVEDEWKTNRTYNENYSEIPNVPGVYLLVKTDLNLKTGEKKYEILYVGSSKNLKQRHARHEVLRILTEIYGSDIRFYFKEEQNYLSVEKWLIKQTKARFNKQWR